MAIEVNAVVVSDLNEDYPQDRDYLSEGGAHIRLVKKILKNTFPNLTEPMEVGSDFFKIFANKLSLTGDAFNMGGLMVKNAQPGTADNDLTTKGQVEALMKNWMQNRLYRPGSYYISEDPTNPGDSSVLGFGQWVQVTGMIMGAGAVNPDGSVPNAQRRDFVAGSVGGRVYNDIRPENLPLTTIDLAASGARTSVGGGHAHNIPAEFSRYSVNDVQSRIYREGGGNTYVYPTSYAGDHSHVVQGTISFGRDNVSRQPVDTMPPHRVAYIWRRQS